MIVHYIVEKFFFCRYCLQSLSTDKILKTHVKVCFKVIGKQMVKMPNLDEFYTTKYQKHVAFSYGYKLVCADEKLVILLSHT